jgi:hypothetical protein
MFIQNRVARHFAVSVEGADGADASVGQIASGRIPGESFRVRIGTEVSIDDLANLVRRFYVSEGFTATITDVSVVGEGPVRRAKIRVDSARDSKIMIILRDGDLFSLSTKP